LQRPRLKGADNASHDGNVEQKVRMIEKIDALIKHLLDNVDLENVFIALTADHTTSLDLRKHVGDPVPLAIMGSGVRADSVEKYSEIDCAQGCLGRIRGVDLTPILMDLAGNSKTFGA
jgi:2,3-bisphosphoglycerate-independent phosphoglycerate mutase